MFVCVLVIRNCVALTDPVGSALTKIKNDPKVVYYFWQPQLDDFRTLLLRDYDEIVRNINELSEWIENNK